MCAGLILFSLIWLGKTVQAIAFLASLLESGENGPFLVIVPSSTAGEIPTGGKYYSPKVPSCVNKRFVH